METAGSANKPGNPLWLLAEVTYKCPLHCVFCYNPVDYTRYGPELDTQAWLRVLREGRELGATQLGFSGGEPLMRDDLEEMVTEARRLGYYSNLITSGIGLTEKRIAAFKEGGLDHIQLSFQDSTREMNDFLSSTKTFDLKKRTAELIQKYDYPMVLNVVLHRHNIDHTQQILEMAQQLGAEYVELANTQYYAWAFENRDQLLPSRDQLMRAEEVTNRFRERVGNAMKVYFVVPDYHATRPKACMNGWGSLFVTVTADGVVLPCHEARMLPGLTFPNVRDHPLRWIWYDSPGFNAYRGDGWMQEPCRSCPDKVKDFGGCRCQAFMLTGDATNADPVCELSPHHHLVTEAVERADRPALPAGVKPIVFRDDRNSRALSAASEPATPVT
ncbi:MAG: pyrroloquinoline quinone biosynthesis protein PqqE [Betaproteobacteria bacterium]|jgi:pyrroloquinoline quinone biosynthesis protein E|nr:pyrroloquinoline quinone biosynthesis protein PqqE [Rhodocyclaceae bacterium]MCA3133072.1 pyrroloquinoline quinone biosynthesis protein PqqE [Rhodocyclaceae bacterium]MCA3141849.1 pyrroloquinoline quinone biosynthesis protein PqqE [Rhodocyclaceae bacterium]MCA3144757.1 pyrroloquinoline quinone biosynthesis protein PqqE [Rhodocyclaceae bacterium]MCE2896663.1 pyrroloquinoline quinone biosynthesis protein PqqE [Betaproteobacteria bacterium]